MKRSSVRLSVRLSVPSIDSLASVMQAVAGISVATC